MGILDDLKREASRLQGDQERVPGGEAYQEQRYHEVAKPLMKQIATYLCEMTEQLKVVQLPVPVAYDIPGIGLVKELYQGDYRVYLDSREAPRKIAFQFACTSGSVNKYSVTPLTAAEEARQFMRKQQIHFSEWGIRDSQERLMGAHFECQMQIQVKLVFATDMENERLVVTSINRHGLTIKHSNFSFDSIDDKWMDELGHYILRKNEQMGVLDIPESARQEIQKRVKEEQLRREAELRGSHNKEHQLPEERMKKRSGKLEKVFKTFSKPLFTKK